MAKPNIFKRSWAVLRTLLVAFGILFIAMLILSFTTLPYWGYYWLGTSQSKISGKPDYIVLLGGGGMPSESSLMRAFFVHRAAIESPNSRIVISIPGNPTDSLSTARLVAAELVLKGISPERILFEQTATNTRSEAIQLQHFNREILTDKSILLVTSPEHMRRAVLVFKKAGFTKVSALPTFENAIEADLFFEDDKLGGDKLLVPDIGDNTAVRYQFWNHLKYEILIAREMAALAYYKLRGWI
ncbi:MAG: YdcF family protein [Prolixibacteraceae bacterium]|nr:YdcF family protein [Prolixibacteraceae bacterium]